MADNGDNGEERSRAERQADRDPLGARMVCLFFFFFCVFYYSQLRGSFEDSTGEYWSAARCCYMNKCCASSRSWWCYCAV